MTSQLDAGHEGLRQREDDEHDHGGQEHHAPPDLVGQPAAEQRADQRPALRAGRGQAEQPAGRDDTGRG